jgi:hypothetical protein
MKKIKEEFIEVKNEAGLIQFFMLYLYYADLEHPVTYNIYPHEFNTWNDLEEQKKALRSKGYSLAKKLYQEQEFRKRQLEMFPLQFN